MAYSAVVSLHRKCLRLTLHMLLRRNKFLVTPPIRWTKTHGNCPKNPSAILRLLRVEHKVTSPPAFLCRHCDKLFPDRFHKSSQKEDCVSFDDSVQKWSIRVKCFWSWRHRASYNHDTGCRRCFRALFVNLDICLL